MDVFIVPDATKDPRFKDSPLVTGQPLIRFYAGAPLMTPDGYKLGTLCIIDTNPRPAGLDLAEKQNLRELAGMVMDNMICRKTERRQLAKDKERLIACTSHDLLTPLTCILLNLSLLNEDDHLNSCMDNNHRDLLNTAINCTNIIDGICRDSIRTFRSESDTNKMLKNESQETYDSNEEICLGRNDSIDNPETAEFRSPDNGAGTVVMSQLVNNIRHVMESYPKNVPLTLAVSDDVPPVIITNALGIFRSALNILTNACRLTQSGAIDFRVFVKRAITNYPTRENTTFIGCNKSTYEHQTSNDSLVFECVDSGPGVDVENLKDLYRPFGGVKGRIGHEGNLGLGLFSVSRHIGGLGGDFGYRPRDNNENQESNGSVFWFSVPILTPQTSNTEAVQEESGLVNDSCFEFIGEREMVLLANPAETLMKTRYVKRKLDVPDTPVQNERLHRYLDHQPVRMTSNNFSDFTSNSFAALKIETSMMSNRISSDSTTLLQKRCLGNTGVCTDDSTNSSGISNLGARKKVALVIDDSKIICKVFQKALVRLGFEVKLAGNGMEGLKRMQRYVFDLVFCDFLMPIMDGLDCVQQYREWERKQRPWFEQYIIGISAHSGREDSDRGLKIGMNKFYSKPLHLKTLIEIIESNKVVASSHRLDKLAETTDAVPYCIFSNRLHVSESECSLASLIVNRSVCLIAEDSKSIYQAMARCLELKGWGVSVVANGEDALRLLKMRNWNVVFMSCQLPLLSSSACIAKFRKWETENRIARQDNIHMVSANLNPNVETMLPIGFDGVLNKPFKPLQLYEVLESASNKPTIL